MSAQSISTAIKNTLTAVRDNNNPVFKDILERATNDFSGFPSLTIVNVDTSTEMATTAEDLWMYKYMITGYIVDDRQEGWQQARRLQEMIMDAINESNDLGHPEWIVMPAVMEGIENEVISGGEHLKIMVSVIIKLIKNI